MTETRMEGSPGSTTGRFIARVWNKNFHRKRQPTDIEVPLGRQRQKSKRSSNGTSRGETRTRGGGTRGRTNKYHAAMLPGGKCHRGECPGEWGRGGRTGGRGKGRSSASVPKFLLFFALHFSPSGKKGGNFLSFSLTSGRQAGLGQGR